MLVRVCVCVCNCKCMCVRVCECLCVRLRVRLRLFQIKKVIDQLTFFLHCLAFLQRRELAFSRTPKSQGQQSNE